MKKLPRLLLFTLLAAAAPAFAGEAPKAPAAPHQGKILEVDNVRAEFVVRPDRTVEVFLYDDKMQPLAPAAQTVTIVAQAKDAPVTQALDKQEKSFVAAKPLPPGEGYTVVVQLKLQADKPPRNFRIPLDLAVCDECKLAEYACTCTEHDHAEPAKPPTAPAAK